MPYYNIFILDVFFRGRSDEGFNSCSSTGLICEFSAGEELVVCVFSEPDCVVGEFGAFRVEGIGIREKQLQLAGNISDVRGGYRGGT